MCHECGYTCEKPNPLKIHLALDCGKSPRAKLWSRLAATVAETAAAAAEADSDDDRKIQASFRFSLTTGAADSRKPLPSSAAAESAFRPYSPESSASSGGGLAPILSPTRQRRPPLPPQQPSVDRTPPPPPPLSSRLVGGDDAAATFFDRRCAEMETIVSNLGHSEQGHLCIYCGKVYSRKYGLKIHIRYTISTPHRMSPKFDRKCLLQTICYDNIIMSYCRRAVRSSIPNESLLRFSRKKFRRVYIYTYSVFLKIPNARSERIATDSYEE